MGLGVDKRVHYFGERVYSRKVVLLGKGMEMVCIEVVLESNCVGMVVVPCMVHMAHKVVGMVDKDWGHMEGFGDMGLVSKVVQNHVEWVVHRHVVVVVDNHNKGYHIH